MESGCTKMGADGDMGDTMGGDLEKEPFKERITATDEFSRNAAIGQVMVGCMLMSLLIELKLHSKEADALKMVTPSNVTGNPLSELQLHESQMALNTESYTPASAVASLWGSLANGIGRMPCNCSRSDANA